VAAKSSYLRCFLILRCRLFLSLRCRRRKGCDCSPPSRERELGLDRRETGWFYPTISQLCMLLGIWGSTRGTPISRFWYRPLVDKPAGRSYARGCTAEGLLSWNSIHKVHIRRRGSNLLGAIVPPLLRPPPNRGLSRVRLRYDPFVLSFGSACLPRLRRPRELPPRGAITRHPNIPLGGRNGRSCSETTRV